MYHPGGPPPNSHFKPRPSYHGARIYEYHSYLPPPPLPTGSFDSIGSHRPPPIMVGSAGPPTPPYYNGPPISYSSSAAAAMPGPYAYYGPWHPPTHPIEYITNIKPQDVLSGRGGATNSHSGNRAFRCLVKKYQQEYLLAKKRDKPSVAAVIVDLIRKKGGRFMRRVETDGPTTGGHVFYVDIGDMRAREKTCQALREGAPAIRRQKQVSSDESDHPNRTESKDQSEDQGATLSSSGGSTLDQKPSAELGEEGLQAYKTRLTKEGDSDHEDHHQHGSEGPIMIRPIARLMPCRPPIDPFPLDLLSAGDREMYLRDFLPPCPPIRKRRRESHDDLTVDEGDFADYHAGDDGHSATAPWRVLQV